MFSLHITLKLSQGASRRVLRSNCKISLKSTLKLEKSSRVLLDFCQDFPREIVTCRFLLIVSRLHQTWCILLVLASNLID